MIVQVDPDEVERAAQAGAVYIADVCRSSEEAFNWARRGGDVAVLPVGELYVSHADVDAMEDNAASGEGFGSYPGAVFPSGWAINMGVAREVLDAAFPHIPFRFYRLAPVSVVIGPERREPLTA